MNIRLVVSLFTTTLLYFRPQEVGRFSGSMYLITTWIRQRHHLETSKNKAKWIYVGKIFFRRLFRNWKSLLHWLRHSESTARQTTKQDLHANWSQLPPLLSTRPTKGWPQHRELRALLFLINVWDLYRPQLMSRKILYLRFLWFTCYFYD